ncbi:aldehyde dehydrogenase [Cavenderia fasciculata]|uniref:NADP-dependent glyceraldehyde-3-phosphate dehydrogenase n=1 Tax=Cavenderia fasciculata TaxID=261658 RepID=F4Q986_CACFS|nr:aldehyde dehydrogenase [Cavenderia fasciculata]EGG15255.1 aldehyde dehydrogenase [Cavenderia fasciculata]|eukprot:XP_004351975.1 aldehyde dehydrogenase [Cavenderia fasciculata]
MSQAIFKRVGNYVRESYPIYVGSKAVTSTPLNRLGVVDKYTNQVVSHVPMADKKIINDAINQAVQSESKMKSLTASHRKDVLLDMANKIKNRADELAATIVVEVGKPLADARAEVGRAIDTFTVAAEEAIRQNGEYIPLDISAKNNGFQAISKRFPVGAVSMIAPFNFPLNLCAHKIAPAIAAGCPFVLKPSDRTPISAILLGEMLAECDLPAGAFSIFPTELADAPILSKDERFKLVSFTGSPQVGWKIKDEAGRKKVVLELGGNAACIVDEAIKESYLHHVAARILFGGFYAAGQSCISVQRVYIHERHYNQLKTILLEQTQPLSKRRGDPMNINTFHGPMIGENDAIRVEKWVNDAVSKGATLLTGGKRDKAFFDLTILENVPQTCDVSCKEIFGPVFVIEKFTDFKDVVNRVNNSEFGLQAGVFTDDIHKAHYAFNHIDVGAVVINDIPSVRVDSQAYGGIKGSGLGREGVKNTIEEYTELKLMIMKDVGKL